MGDGGGGLSTVDSKTNESLWHIELDNELTLAPIFLKG
jgi:hypothetical protein